MIKCLNTLFAARRKPGAEGQEPSPRLVASRPGPASGSRLSSLVPRLFLALLLAFAGVADSAGADRVLRAQDFTVARGQTNTLRISLEGLGDENALGFTVCFDTNLLALVPPVRRGVAISNLFPSATFTPNTQALETNGWIGLVIGLDIGNLETWPAGTNELVEIQFRALPGAGSSNTVIALCDNVTNAKSPTSRPRPSTRASSARTCSWPVTATTR